MSLTPSAQAARPQLTAALILALCFVLALVARGMVETFTTFILPLSGEYGWSRAALNSIYGVYALTAAIAAPAVGWLLDRFGPKRLYLLGVALLTAAFLGASQAAALWQFQLLIGAMVGFAFVMLGMVPHTVVLSRWYVYKLSSAMGIVQASNGLGIFIIVPVAQVLIDGWGWRAAYMGLGAIAAALVVPLLFARREALERKPPERAGEEAAAAQAPAGPAPGEWTLKGALGTVSFWCLFSIFFFTSIGNFAVVPQMVPLLVSTGLDPLKAASVFGVMGTFAMVGLIGYGWLSDRVGVFRAASMSYTGSVAGFAVLLVMLQRPSAALLWLYAVLFGPSMGARFPMVASYAAALFRGPSMGRIFGAICVGQGAGTAIGSYAGGLLLDLSGGYGPVAAFGLANMALAYTPFVIIRLRGLR